MKQHFRMFAAYNSWANSVLYTAVTELSEEEFNRDVGVFFKSLMGTLNHILVADRIWMHRITGEEDAPRSLDTILYRNFTNLRLAREKEDRRIRAFIEGLSSERLAGRFTYRTITDMKTISQRLSPVLAHVFNHEAHHRGQAHAALTMLGKPSISLDLVSFQRTEEGRAFA